MRPRSLLSCQEPATRSQSALVGRLGSRAVIRVSKTVPRSWPREAALAALAYLGPRADHPLRVLALPRTAVVMAAAALAKRQAAAVAALVVRVALEDLGLVEAGVVVVVLLARHLRRS